MPNAFAHRRQSATRADRSSALHAAAACRGQNGAICVASGFRRRLRTGARGRRGHGLRSGRAPHGGYGMTARRALVVDDSRSARAFLTRLLERYELAVDEVESAEQAIEYLNHERPMQISWIT